MRTGAIEPDITAAGTINLLTLRHPGRATPNEDRCRSARSSSAGYAKPRSALVMVGYCHRSSLSPPEPLGWDQRGIERNACIACVRRG
jgi:hypothetical protein